MNRVFFTVLWLPCSSVFMGCMSGSPEDDDLVLSTDSTEQALTVRATIHNVVSEETGVRLIFSTDEPEAERLTSYREDSAQSYWQRAYSMGHDGRSGTYSYLDTQASVGHEYCYSVAVVRQGQNRFTMGENACLIHNGGLPALEPPPEPANLKTNQTKTDTIALSFVDRSWNPLCAKRATLDT